MAKKLLIDLRKFRDLNITGSSDKHMPEGIDSPSPNTNGLKTIRELAVFKYTCRRCEEAPCIDVCPAEALEKDEQGIVTRYTNLCIACKSCVAICPFGTMMNDFFEHKRTVGDYFDLNDEHEMNMFLEACPDGSAEMVEMDEDPEQNIFKLTDKVLVKEIPWEGLK